MTERAGRYVFSVKEYDGGQPWLMLELFDGEQLSVLRRGFLGFDLPPGTDIEDAHQLADLLNEKIQQVTYTAG